MKNEKNEKYSTHEGEEKCTEKFVGRHKGGDYLTELNADGRMILKW
jgi:hypothetical protein